MTARVVRFSGLYLDPNPHSEVPEGALQVARNVDIRERGFVHGRRGYFRRTPGSQANLTAMDPLTASFVRNDQAIDTADRLVVTDDSETRTFDGGGSLVLPPANTTPQSVTFPLHSAATSRNALFMATDFGVAFFRTSTVMARVGFRDGSTSVGENGDGLTSTGGTLWLADGDSVAYRTTVEKKRGDRTIVSAPSERLVITNDQGGPRAPDLLIGAATTSVDAWGDVSSSTDKIRLYRSFAVSAGFPSDEMFLVAVFDASTNFAHADYLPEEAIKGGDALYTNPTEQTIANRNIRPPFSKILMTYQGSLFAANVITDWEHTFSSSYVSNGDQTGNATGIGLRTYTGDTTSGSPTISNVSSTVGLEVGQIINSGAAGFLGTDAYIISIVGSTVTASRNSTVTQTGAGITFHDAIHLEINTPETDNSYALASTAISLYNSINKIQGSEIDTDSDVYIVALTGIPGFSDGGTARFSLRMSTKKSDAAFDTAPLVWATHGDDYVPSFPALADDGLALTRREEPALAFYSKRFEPDHFTASQQFYVGDSDKAILGGVTASNVLYVFKEDGIFTVTGAGAQSGFREDHFDMTHRAMTSRHICEADGAAACWTDRGIILIFPNGEIRNITDDRIGDLLSVAVPGNNYDGNMDYDQLNEELVFCARSSAENFGPYCFVYHSHTNTWTQRTLPQEDIHLVTRNDSFNGGEEHVGLFTSANRLWIPYTISPTAPALPVDEPWQIYADHGPQTITITNVTNNVVTFTHTSPFQQVQAGDMLAQSSGTIAALVDSVTTTDASGATVVVIPVAGTLTAAAGQLWYGIDSEMKLLNMGDQEIGAWKRWLGIYPVFEGPQRLYWATVALTSNRNTSEQTVRKQIPAYELDGTQRSYPTRMWVSADHSLATHLSPGVKIYEAGGKWKISELVAVGRPTGRKVVA